MTPQTNKTEVRMSSFNLRLSEETMKKVREEAKKEDRSINKMIETLLKRQLGK